MIEKCQEMNTSLAQKAVTVISLLALAAFQYQLLGKVVRQIPDYRHVKKAAAVAQRRNQELSQQLDLLKAQTELYSQCSVGHDTLARQSFGFKKRAEIYVTFEKASSAEEDDPQQFRD